MLRPLIAICGTTGVGKSNLAIDIAVHLSKSSGSKGARIINADSMQVYSGMDVITNKVPEAERQGVEHLLMGFKRPGEQYIVGQWVQDAIKLVGCLRIFFLWSSHIQPSLSRSTKHIRGIKFLS